MPRVSGIGERVAGTSLPGLRDAGIVQAATVEPVDPLPSEAAARVAALRGDVRLIDAVVVE